MLSASEARRKSEAAKNRKPKEPKAGFVDRFFATILRIEAEREIRRSTSVGSTVAEVWIYADLRTTEGTLAIKELLVKPFERRGFEVDLVPSHAAPLEFMSVAIRW